MASKRHTRQVRRMPGPGRVTKGSVAARALRKKKDSKKTGIRHRRKQRDIRGRGTAHRRVIKRSRTGSRR